MSGHWEILGHLQAKYHEIHLFPVDMWSILQKQWRPSTACPGHSWRGTPQNPSRSSDNVAVYEAQSSSIRTLLSPFLIRIGQMADIRHYLLHPLQPCSTSHPSLGWECVHTTRKRRRGKTSEEWWTTGVGSPPTNVEGILSFPRRL